MKISNQLNKFASLITIGTIGGCAPIMPRPFVPLTEPPEAVTKAEFETAFQTCVAEITNGTGNIAYSRNAGTAAGVATTAVAGTGVVAATSMLTTVGASAGSLGMGIILAPVAYGYGVSRGVAVIKRNGKEHQIQQSLEACMAKSDYKIVSWRKIEPTDNVNIVTPIAKPKE